MLLFCLHQQASQSVFKRNQKPFSRAKTALAFCSALAVAQNTNTTCSSGFVWVSGCVVHISRFEADLEHSPMSNLQSFNSKGQSPRTVASYLTGVCEGGCESTRHLLVLSRPYSARCDPQNSNSPLYRKEISTADQAVKTPLHASAAL